MDEEMDYYSLKLLPSYLKPSFYQVQSQKKEVVEIVHYTLRKYEVCLPV